MCAKFKSGSAVSIPSISFVPYRYKWYQCMFKMSKIKTML